jgi:hypothetical protein
MYITDIEENEKLTIESYSVDGKVSYNVRIKKVLLTGIICTAIIEYKDDEKVVIDITKSHNDVVFTPKKGLPIIWKNVDINIETILNKTTYFIKTSSEGVSFYRRENNRIFLGIRSIATFKNHNDQKLIYDRNATLKDISITGFGFLSKFNINTDEFKDVMLSFKYGTERKSLLITGSITRKIAVGEEFFYGVRMIGNTSSVKKIINKIADDNPDE